MKFDILKKKIKSLFTHDNALLVTCYPTIYLGNKMAEVYLSQKDKWLLEGPDKTKILVCQPKNGDQLTFNCTVEELTDLGIIVRFMCFDKHKKEIISNPTNEWFFEYY